MTPKTRNMLLMGSFLQLVGYVLIGSLSGEPLIAVAVFFLIWGNNICRTHSKELYKQPPNT